MSDRTAPIIPDPTGDLARVLAKLQADAGSLTEADWAILRSEYQRKHDAAYRPKIWALLRAGWTFELPAGPDPDIMSWYWRRPPRRAGRPGRRYPSTDQAYNALMREGS